MEVIDKPELDLINKLGEGKEHLFRIPEDQIALCGYKRKSKEPLRPFNGPTNHHCNTCVMIAELELEEV